MKRAVQAVTLLAIALWLACFASAQFAIWNTARRGDWTIEFWTFGGFAAALSLLAWAGWALLPPPEPPAS